MKLSYAQIEDLLVAIDNSRKYAPVDTLNVRLDRLTVELERELQRRDDVKDSKEWAVGE